MKRIIFFLTLTFCFLAFNVINQNNKKGLLQIDKEETSYNLKNENIKLFLPGLDRFISSLFWIDTLLESDLKKHYNPDKNSWLFYRFKNIAKLDPFFYENYSIGGKYLSIIKNDIEGANTIYGYGIKIFRHDFWLLIDSAFNYYFEMGDLKNSLNHYERALEMEETKTYFPILPSIVAKLKREQGAELKDLFNIMSLAYKNETIPSLKKRFYDSLYAIKAEIDLSCLNSNNQSCNLKDLDGINYVNKNGTYESVKQWKRFRISEKARKGAGEAP